MDHANSNTIDKYAGNLFRRTSTHVLLRHTIKNFSHPSGHAVKGAGLRHARWLALWVRIPAGAWMFVSCA